MLFIMRHTMWFMAMWLISCHAFAPNNVGIVSSAARRPFITKDTALMASVADYSGAAQTLFGNVVSPAALLAGGLVPLGFLAQPPPGNSRLERRLRAIYSLLAVLSLANELTAIVYATVASNKLVEIASLPATSVFALIKRDYELQWIATNVHFLFGLFGYLLMIGLRAFCFFPCNLNRAAAGICTSAVLGMFSIVNRGVSAGDGAGSVFGSSIVSLVLRYHVLMWKHVRKSGGVVAMASIALGLVSTVWAVKAVVSCPKENDSDVSS